MQIIFSCSEFISICHNFRLQNTSQTWSLIKNIITLFFSCVSCIYNCAQDRYISTDKILIIIDNKVNVKIIK
uniref:Uncharacterized protein n=1 Tax=Lepeophtheirus salmonis TaxID=72036 RepID=A0A0K2VGN4_LEPSM